MSIDWFALKPILELKGGHHCDGVWLLEGEKAVLKKLNMANPAQRAAFAREVEVLKYLTERACPFTPALLAVNLREGQLVMSYCGDPVLDTKESRAEEAKVRRVLRQKWKISQVKSGLLKRFMYWAGHNRYLHNVARGADGIMKLIDFGSKSWRRSK